MRSVNLDYLPRLDHLRLLAALLVFAFHFFHYYHGQWQPHTNLPWLALIVEGHTGVSLFFVLSGFIFMLIALSGGAIAYSDFLRNRVLRIVPLFAVVFLVAISIGRDRFQPADVFYLLFTNIGLAPTSWHFATGPAWSISVEFTFYLIFPFLARFTLQRGPGYLLGLLLMLLIIKVGAYAASEKSTHMLYSTLIGRFDQFIWGMLAAIVHHRFKDRIAGAGTILLLMSSVMVVSAVILQARHASFFLAQPKQLAWIWWGTIEGVLWGALIVSYLGSAIRIPAKIDRVLSAGGEWSFSFYMWHAMIIFIVHHFAGFIRITGTTGIDLILNGVGVLGLALAFSCLSYSIIERPFLQLRGSYMK